MMIDSKRLEEIIRMPDYVTPQAKIEHVKILLGLAPIIDMSKLTDYVPPLMTFNEAVIKCCKVNPNSDKEDGEVFVKGLEALGLLKLDKMNLFPKYNSAGEIVDSPRPVDRDDLKRDFNIYLADLETAIKGFKDCIREL